MKTFSKIIKFPITQDKIINVTITKKRMKNIRLSISKTGDVKISMPYSTSYSYAYQFLVRKRGWISNQFNQIHLNLSKYSCNFNDNGNIFLLGNNYPLHIVNGSKNSVIFNNYIKDENVNTSISKQNLKTPYGFTIYVKDPAVNIKDLFIKWCKKYFLDFFANRLNYIYSQMFKNITPPSIKIKTMKTMWGNCNFVKNIVTLNLYLAKTPLVCIDYVIVHELAHLIHHNHSKEFHNLVTTILPDWKDRKKLLNTYSLAF